MLRKFIGPPLKRIFQDVFSLTQEETDRIVDRYRVLHNDTNAIVEAEVYPGIEGLLGRLNAAGARVGIASVKRETSVVETLEIYGIEKYFDAVAGAPPGVAYAD